MPVAGEVVSLPPEVSAASAAKKIFLISVVLDIENSVFYINETILVREELLYKHLAGTDRPTVRAI